MKILRFIVALAALSLPLLFLRIIFGSWVGAFRAIGFLMFLIVVLKRN